MILETNFWLFLAAACLIAAVPGPGIFYVAARTLSEGRGSGFASTAGTALGGLVHVVAGGLGISAIILASAELFAAVKFVGALYLVWLGIKTFRSAGRALSLESEPIGDKRAFRDGVLVEALNPTVKNQIISQIMAANLADEAQSWVLSPDGSYARDLGPEGAQLFSCHQFFMQNPSLSGRGTAAKDAPRLIPVQDDEAGAPAAAR